MLGFCWLNSYFLPWCISHIGHFSCIDILHYCLPKKLLVDIIRYKHHFFLEELFEVIATCISLCISKVLVPSLYSTYFIVLLLFCFEGKSIMVDSICCQQILSSYFLIYRILLHLGLWCVWIKIVISQAFWYLNRVRGPESLCQWDVTRSLLGMINKEKEKSSVISHVPSDFSPFSSLDHRNNGGTWSSHPMTIRKRHTYEGCQTGRKKTLVMISWKHYTRLVLPTLSPYLLKSP